MKKEEERKRRKKKEERKRKKEKGRKKQEEECGAPDVGLTSDDGFLSFLRVCVRFAVSIGDFGDRSETAKFEISSGQKRRLLPTSADSSPPNRDTCPVACNRAPKKDGKWIPDKRLRGRATRRSTTS